MLVNISPIQVNQLTFDPSEQNYYILTKKSHKMQSFI